jgi:LmbE family N-acetylglucosaminyl deacetylase
MLPLHLGFPKGNGQPLRVLCLGAHADDIEIGLGGTILTLVARRPLVCRWVVLSGGGTARESEARHGAQRFLQDAQDTCVAVHGFRDGFFPAQYADLKECFEELKRDAAPDVIFTHYREDRHQDHRIVSELTWSTFRSHLVLEYEVPKYDGDLARPNCYVPLSRRHVDAKVRHLIEVFESQHAKHWFTADTFTGLLRIRGIEAGNGDAFAEAFHAHKTVLDV